jgi:hypothetical protein
MGLQIRYETASLLILSIGDSGLIRFGSGQPVSLLTIGGTAVIDIHGLMVW